MLPKYTAGSTDFGYFEWFIIGNIAIIEKAKSTCHTAFAQGTNLPYGLVLAFLYECQSALEWNPKYHNWCYQ